MAARTSRRRLAFLSRAGDAMLPGWTPQRPARLRRWSIPFGRAISYVRVSVTDRCDFRCVYCMSEDMTFLPKRDVLSLEELDRLCSAFVRLGTRKFASPAASRWCGATS